MLDPVDPEPAPIAIRRMQPADADFVRDLARRVFNEYRPNSGGHTLRLAARDSSTTFIATARERRVGFVVVDLGPTGAYLDAIAVEEAFRGRRIGAALLTSAETEARRIGAAELRLVTAEANVAALDLFTKHGLIFDRRHGPYYAHGQAAVSLHKRLA
jgi:ribosomal protein S18 acetylase RimI-like enzyme